MDIYIYPRKLLISFGHGPVIFGILTEFLLSKIVGIERLRCDKSRTASWNFTKLGMDIIIWLRKFRLIFCHAPVIFGFLTEIYFAKIGDIQRLGRNKSRTAL